MKFLRTWLGTVEVVEPLDRDVAKLREELLKTKALLESERASHLKNEEEWKKTTKNLIETIQGLEKDNHFLSRRVQYLTAAYDTLRQGIVTLSSILQENDI